MINPEVCPMSLIMNHLRFKAYPTMPVAVFEYWTVKGALVRECVPLVDDYNLERLTSYTPNWQCVGCGLLKAPIGYAFYNDTWSVLWERQQETQPNPYDGRYFVRRWWRITRKKIVFRLKFQHFGRIEINIDETGKFKRGAS